MSVPFSDHGEEKVAGADEPGIDSEPAEQDRGGALKDPSVHSPAQFFQADLGHAHFLFISMRRDLMTSISLKGMVLSLKIW